MLYRLFMRKREMNREQEDRLLEDYIETLREESNWSVSFLEYKDREKTRIKNYE